MDLMKPMTTEVTYFIDPAEALPGVEKMLYSLAWRCSQTYGVPFQEVMSECYVGFMNACRAWRPGKSSKFSSFAYKWIATDLITFITKRAKDPHIAVEVNDQIETFGFTPEERSPSLELLEELSLDAQEIIYLIIEMPEEVIGWNSATPRQLLHKVKKYLTEVWGDQTRVDKAHKEIATALQEAWA